MKLKLLSLLAAMVMVICLLASCGGGGGNEGEGEGEGGEYPWSSAEILVQLYENSNSNELSSGLKRYYAGAETGKFETVDTYVTDRNKAAISTTKVTPLYNYKTEYAWGGAVDEINRLGKSGTGDAPDVFVNFAYDMTSAAIRGSFANLYANTSKAASTVKYNESSNNYYRFAQSDFDGIGEGYFDSNAGEGYFYDYMQSLSLSDDKVYCLASNYCVDLVRAFLVMPVNVSLMNSVALNDSTGDEYADGDFDIDDFYELVWDGRWTYDVLEKYAAAIAQEQDNVNGWTIGDTLGLALGTGSGLTGSGILYTTSVQIINKTANGDGTYTYSYPTTNQGLIDLATRLTTLIESRGVAAVSGADVTSANIGVTKDLEGIRTQFAANKVLFGGVIALGSLEDTVYQKMETGFGIVPVPLYKSGDEYRTLVHNLARICAVSSTTSEFDQCSAFLNYQSINSKNVIDAYYTQVLADAVSDGAAGENNVKMLSYIRNHVRDCFDKTYEDVVANYGKATDANTDDTKWHVELQRKGYKFTNIGTFYEEIYETKQSNLNKIVGTWNGLQ